MRFVHIIAGSVVCLILLLSSIPFSEYTTVCLSILLLMDTWAVSSFWLLLRIKLHVHILFMSHEYIFSWTYTFIFLGKYLEAELLGHQVSCLSL